MGQTVAELPSVGCPSTSGTERIAAPGRCQGMPCLVRMGERSVPLPIPPRKAPGVSHREPHATDGQLIEATLAGRRECFDELFRRYRPPLLRAAQSRLPHQADDVVQETLLCALKSLASYDSRFSFRTWLWAIMLNQCRRQLGRARRRPLVNALWDGPTDEHDRPADMLVCAQPGPVERLLARERAEQLHRLLVELPQPQADALRLRFFGGLKFHEIAQAMGCSLPTAKNRVRAGLTKIGRKLRHARTAAGNDTRPAIRRCDGVELEQDHLQGPHAQRPGDE